MEGAVNEYLRARRVSHSLLSSTYPPGASAGLSPSQGLAVELDGWPKNRVNSAFLMGGNMYD